MLKKTTMRLASHAALAVLLFEPATALVALRAGWAAYKTLLSEKPVLTKSLTSGAIMGVSDAMTQKLERRWQKEQSNVAHSSETPTRNGASAVAEPSGHNWLRTFHTIATGICWSGPSAHIWYSSLEKICNLFPVHGRIAGLIQRLVLDSLIFSPVTIAGFFVVSTIIQQNAVLRPRKMRVAVDEIRIKLTTKWARALVGAWSFWPPVNVFNFSLVPLKYRVLYANVMALLWTGYLSFLNYQKKKVKAEPQAE